MFYHIIKHKYLLTLDFTGHGVVTNYLWFVTKRGEARKNYLQNNSILQIPESIKDRTQKYLELSCIILPWFKENYERTNDKEFIKIKEIYDNFATSNFFYNLSKEEKRKYNKTFFNEYFETNIFLRGFYAERCNNIRSVIKGWKLKIENENEDE